MLPTFVCLETLSKPAESAMGTISLVTEEAVEDLVHPLCE